MASTAIVYNLVARDKASAQFKKAGHAAGGLESTLSHLGKAARGAGLALAGIGVGLGKAAKDAADFQTEMTKISTQAGASTKDVRLLSDQVLKLGTVTQQGPQALAESLYHLKSVGLDNVGAMKALKQSSDLAAVGGANLEETTNALAGAWRTGIKGAGNFHEAVSTVNAIIGAGNMRMEDFNAAIGTGMLASAKTFGLSLKQVGAALALMTDEGVPANAAATRLRMSFSLLGAPSRAAEKQLKKIGLTGLQLGKAMRGSDGLIGAIQLLKDHLDKSGMSAAQASQLLSRAFGGGRSSSGILTMINNLDVLKKKQEQVNDSTGRFDDAVKQQQKTASAQWHLLLSNMQTLSIKIGTKVLPPITDLISYVNKTALPALATFKSRLLGMVPVSRITADIKSAKHAVAGFFSYLTGGHKKKKAPRPVPLAPHSGYGQVAPIKPMKKTAPKGPPGPHSGYGQIAPVMPTMAPHSGYGQVAPVRLAKTKVKASGVKIDFSRLGKTISSAIGRIDWNKVGSGLGHAIGTSFQWLVKHAATITKQLAKALGGLDWVNIGKEVGGKAVGFAIGFISSLGSDLFSADFWKKHWLDTIIAAISLVGFGKIAGVLGKILSKIPFLRAFSPLLHGIEHLTAPISKAIGKVIKFFGSSLWKGFARVFPRAAGVLEREAGLLTTRLGVWGMDLLKMGGKAVRWLGNGIKKGAEWVIAKIGELIGYLLKPWAKAGGWLLKKGAAIVRGLNRGIAAVAKGIWRYVSKWVVKPITNGFRTAGIWLYSKGLDLIRGLNRGIAAVANGIWRFVKKWVISPITNGFRTAGIWLYSKGLDIIRGFNRGIATVAKGIWGFFKRRVVAPILNGFIKANLWLYSKGRAILGGMKRGIVNVAKGIWGWFKGHVITPVLNGFVKANLWLYSKGLEIVRGLKRGTINAAKGIWGWFKSHVVTPITGGFVKANLWLYSKGKALLGGLKRGVVNGMKGIGHWLKSHVIDPIVNAVKHFFGIHSPSTVFAGIGGNLVAGLIKGLARHNGASIARRIFGDLPHALGHIVSKGLVAVTSLPGKALSALGSLGGKLGDLLGGLFGGGGGKGVSRWASTVRTVLGLLGAPMSALGPVLKRIGMESAGNPRAINLWDINARRGHPSQGLMQTIPSTFNRYSGPFRSRGITDPLANVYAGVNYAMHRYGRNWVHVMTRSGGYDSGGVAHGVGYLPKYTPRPERVLSPRQTAAFERLVDLLDQGRVGGGGNSYTINARTADITVRDLELLQRQLDAKQRVGRAK